MIVHMEPCKGGCGKLVPDEGQYGYICWACWKKQRAPTPEAADAAPAAPVEGYNFDQWWGNKERRWNGVMDIREYSRFVWEQARGTMPAPASPGEAPADLREADNAFARVKAFGVWLGGLNLTPSIRDAYFAGWDACAALVRPQAPKAAPPQPQAQPSEADPIPPEDTDLQFRLVRALLINAWECAWSKHPGTALIRAALKTMLPNGFALADARALGEVRDADLAAQPANPQIAGGQL